MWHDKAEGYYMFPELEGEIGSHMMFQGREVLCWSLNNYLGLANHPEVRKPTRKRPPNTAWHTPWVHALCPARPNGINSSKSELANFSHKKYGCLINYGYQGIMSAIDCLLDRHDVVVYDADCHASIIDGIRMSDATRIKFRHNDVADCEKKLQVATKKLKSWVAAYSLSLKAFSACAACRVR